MIIYAGNPKESTEKLPETTNLAKLQETIAIHKSPLHFYEKQQALGTQIIKITSLKTA